jgi:hypothetical protein
MVSRYLSAESRTPRARSESAPWKQAETPVRARKTYSILCHRHWQEQLGHAAGSIPWLLAQHDCERVGNLLLEALRLEVIAVGVGHRDGVQEPGTVTVPV